MNDHSLGTAGGEKGLVPTSLPDYSVDRIAFSAIAVSCATGKPTVLSSLLAFDTSKADSGEAGTFTLTLPMSPTFEGAPNAAPEYAKIANPMDVIAIYALRLVSTDEPVSGSPLSVPQAQPKGITWGEGGFVQNLVITGGGNLGGPQPFNNGTCVFIGMLDEARVKVSMSDSPQAHLLLSGHDMTKVFLSNDSALPVILAALVPGVAIYTDFEQSMAPIIYGIKNGVMLLEAALDYMVARVAPPGTPKQLQVPPELAAYGFPWRNFISLDEIDESFDAFDAKDTPPYRIQSGSAWSNMTDLRNVPINRLYVDEFGNLIFDDAYHAWISDDNSNESIYTITEAEVLDYELVMNDEALVTMLTILPTPGLQSAAALATQYVLKGDRLDQMLPGNNPGTMASPTAIKPEDVQRYGLRYGEYTSFWDVNVPAAQKRWKYLTVNHDSICFAEIVVRGRSLYRVGKRITLNVPAHRPEFSNATWYVTHVAHNGNYGSTWITRLSLRYPIANGALH